MNVSANVEEGKVISVIGPSGVGKSTFQRCLRCLEEPTTGRIVVDGQDILDPSCDTCAVRRKMGMVFQSFNLLNNLNIHDNVSTAPQRLLQTPKDEAKREAMRLLERVG